MKKFLSIIAVAVAALLVSSCGPNYAGYYKADLTAMQSGVFSTIVINEDGTGSILNGASQETTYTTWKEYYNEEGNKVDNCLSIWSDDSEVPYIMNFTTHKVFFGQVNFNNGVGYNFEKIR